ncbi:hypothetical protein H0H87_007215 [Tephrocybe sp. NHM501043]|nr:hypothetical protein H0H87_007215 [Tephrocybe sp. NHM501043]
MQNTAEMRLNEQLPARASASMKIRQAILATAIVDALGGPAEFHKRFTFPLVTNMIPNNNFSLPPGVWTDDTSMTLCLARSLANFNSPSPSDRHTSRNGGFDERDQLERYLAWYHYGNLSAVGRCFDIGSTIRRALDIYADGGQSRNIHVTLQDIQTELSEETCSGNGSLMRILPIGLAYWRDEALARDYARRSSRTTHPNEMCQEACDVWTQVIVQIMQASTSGEKSDYTKLDVVKTFAAFPYENVKLREALALPNTTLPLPSGPEKQEEHFRNYHPILRLVAKMRDMTAENVNLTKLIPSVRDLPSSGYVLHSLIAALYCFLATNSFEEGALVAVNLGNDADTVGAIYAGIAGCWYAGNDDELGGIWTKQVIEWRSKLVQRELVVNVANELARFSVELSGD